MANVKTYVCLVDVYRRPERQRNTHGRYYVGAKNEKEAKKLLQEAIGFGSIQVYYVVGPHNTVDPILNHKEVKKAVWNGNKFETEDVLHATAPHKE